MDQKVTLAEVFQAAAASHTWDSHWTRDGETAQTLDEWWDEAESHVAQDAMFVFDGTRIARQGADIQDYKVLLYLAEERCSICARFVQRDAAERSARADKDHKVMSVLCIDCVSGGVIGEVLRQR